MTKNYCDKCKKETKFLRKNIISTTGRFEINREFELCDECQLILNDLTKDFLIK